MLSCGVARLDIALFGIDMILSSIFDSEGFYIHCMKQII